MKNTRTPTFKPEDRVITTRHGHGIIRNIYGTALLIETRHGLIVGSANTVTKDER
jgi:hypothetical protein